MPLLSYGGSSMIIMTMAVVVLMRIDHEIRLQSLQATNKKKVKKTKKITVKKLEAKVKTKSDEEGEQYDWI